MKNYFLLLAVAVALSLSVTPSAQAQAQEVPIQTLTQWAANVFGYTTRAEVMQNAEKVGAFVDEMLKHFAKFSIFPTAECRGHSTGRPEGWWRSSSGSSFNAVSIVNWLGVSRTLASR
jgi:hypothetical protein